MDASLRKQILQLLDEHRIMTLATLRPDGWPQATTVGYVNEGLTLYFMCGKNSQKARNLSADNRISATIDHDVSDPMAIRGLSFAARALPVTDESALRKTVMEWMPRKYPEYTKMMDSVDLTGIAVYKVEPSVISVLDYRKGFGHSELTPIGPRDLAA